MRVEKQWLTCKKCDNAFQGEMVLDAEIKVFAASMQANRCPRCGAGWKRLLLGRSNVPDPAPNNQEISDQQRRAEWLDLGDNGLSSECIADHMSGTPFPRSDYPLDADDFGRCERLLILYPAWRARLSEMASVNPEWAALVAHWDAIVVEWRHDQALARRKRPKAERNSGWRCSALMQSILDKKLSS